MDFISKKCYTSTFTFVYEKNQKLKQETRDWYFYFCLVSNFLYNFKNVF